MIYIYVDANYMDTYSWIQRYQIIRQTFRSRRIPYRNVSSISEIPEDDPNAMVIIRSATKSFLTEAVIEANEKGVYPVLLANIPAYSGLHCSSIGSDMRDDTLSAIELLRSIKCQSIAFFGVNPSPYSDQYRASIFEAEMKSADDIYHMDKSYSDAFQSFLRNADKYDGVIVGNVATAVALINDMKRHGYTKKTLPRIIAFGHLGLIRYYSPSISTISDDIENIGDIILNLYSFLNKCGTKIKVHIATNRIIFSRETTNFAEPPSLRCYARYSEPLKYNSYLDSPEIAEVRLVERMLQQVDEIDMEILYGILQKKTYENISEELNLSLNSVNYRIRNIKEILGIDAVTELREMLERYLLD